VHGEEQQIRTAWRDAGAGDALCADESVDERPCVPWCATSCPTSMAWFPAAPPASFVYLTPDEQKQSHRDCGRTEVAGRVPVVAGTGASSTRLAVQLARQAQQAGASACLVVTPFFLHPSDKGIYQHFYEVAHSVDIPVILYNIPQVVDAYLPRNRHRRPGR